MGCARKPVAEEMSDLSHSIKFDRFERKHVVPIKAAEAFKKSLGAYLVPDDHGDSGGCYLTITSPGTYSPSGSLAVGGIRLLCLRPAQHGPRLHQVEDVEPFGEPGVDAGQELARFIAPPYVSVGQYTPPASIVAMHRLQ